MKEGCKGIKKDGLPCKALARNGSKFCYSHDPDKPKVKHHAKPLSEENFEMLRAQLMGLNVLPDYQLEKIADMVISKLAESLNLYVKEKKSLMISENEK